MPSANAKEDDAASGIFTYDGSFVSSAQNSHVTTDTNDGSISFAAKVAAENEKVAKEFGLNLGVYGFKGPRSTDGEESEEVVSVNDGSLRTTDDLASTFSGVYDMDDSSFVRNVSADAIFEAQDRADSEDKERHITPPGSKGEETRGTMGLIGDYAVPSSKGSQGGSEGPNAAPQGGIMDTVLRTMVRLGLAWDGRTPSTPESAEKTSGPTGSHEEEASQGCSVSMLSFDGPEVNTTTSASKAPLFKGRTVVRNYPAHSTATAQPEGKPPLLNPARLITVCSCVVLISVALAIGGYIAISRRGDSESTERSSASGLGDDDEFRQAITSTTVGTETSPVPSTELPCGEDSLSSLFDINGNVYDCIWFSERSTPYRNVMCETRPDIADACRETCIGKCDSTTATQGNQETTATTTAATTAAATTTAATTKAATTTAATTTAATTTAATTTAATTTAATTTTTTTSSTSSTTEQAPVVSTPSPVTGAPVSTPTRAPVRPLPTAVPTGSPIAAPTRAPTRAPVAAPTRAPIEPPTRAPTRRPTRQPTNSPVAAPTSAPSRPARVCPPDTEGFIPGSTTTCEEFGRFHPDFRTQRCQSGWPVFTFCFTTCGNCIET
eukprot:scaffold2192_cov170-Amphora_coffeaeformis.AAC.3